MVERVLFVHAHPDDESISTGGTIATLIERESVVTVLTCTRGERVEILAPEHSHQGSDPVAISRARTAELASAMAVLGVTDHRYLGDLDARCPGRAPRRYTDSGMQWGSTAAGLPTPMPVDDQDELSLTAAESGEVAADIAAVIAIVRPHAVVSYNESGGYGHPDHIRVHNATRVAAKVMGVPFFVIDNESPGARVLSVDVTPVFERKRAALDVYRKQLKVVGDGYTTSGGTTEPIGRVERFCRIRVASNSLPGNSFAGSGPGAKIVTCLLAVVLGAFLGIFLTVAHQASVLIAGLTVPWGVIAALLIIAAFGVGLRLVSQTRIVTGCAAIGWLGATALLTVQSPGGSILVPDNATGYLFSYGSVLLTALILAWPRVTRVGRGNMRVPAVKGFELP